MKIKAFFGRQVDKALSLHGTTAQNRPWINSEDIDQQVQNVKAIYEASNSSVTDKSFVSFVQDYPSFSKLIFKKTYITNQITYIVSAAFLGVALFSLVHFLGRSLANNGTQSASFLIASFCATFIIFLHLTMTAHNLWKVRNLTNKNIYHYLRDIKINPGEALPLPLKNNVLDKIEQIWLTSRKK